jgi:hypothetical protein
MIILTQTKRLLAASLLAAGLLGACSGEESLGEVGNGGHAGVSGDSGVGGGLTLPDGATTALLQVDPATTTIDVVDGVAQPVQFTASLKNSDGTSTKVNAQWSLKGPMLGAISTTGLFSPNGTLGGELTVQAKYQTLAGTATAKVLLHTTANPAGASPSDQALLEGATTPDPAVQWAYPYNGTAFPQGLTSPRFMWNGGAADDLYLIKLTGPYAELKYFVKVSPPAQVELPAAPADLWKQVTDSGSGGKMTLFAARLSAGAGTVIANHTDQLASGPLRGTVYYWANSIGRILRIKAGAAAPDDFLAAAGVGGCTACHSVSAKGTRLVDGADLATEKQDMSAFDLVNNQVKLTGKGRAWAFPALSADGSVLVPNNAPLPGSPGGTGAFDVDTGAPLTGTGLEGLKLWMPAFAPDNKALVYLSSTPPNDLRMYDWDATQKVVSNDRLIMPTGSDPNNIIGFLTASPDHHLVAYPRSTAAAWDSRQGPANLYVADTTQPGTEVRLANLNGDTYPFAAGERDRNFNYEPVFAPVPAGGFFWVVFNSRRTYGNLLTGDSTTVKQLWIAAIRMDAKPGEDPSYAAFWLPGQDTQTLNLRGFWALDPCKSNDSACTDGSECCSGNCVYSPDTGTASCKDSNGECSEDGNTCTTNEDCCNYASGKVACIGGICASKGPS